MKFSGLFRREEWTLGVVRQSLADIARDGLGASISWLPAAAPWTFCADPFLVTDDVGRLHLFCEAIDVREGRGEIHHAILDPEQQEQTHFVQMVAETTHLSYPQVFRGDGDDWWMAVENWEGGGLALYRSGQLDGPWTKHAIDFPERPVVDGTFFKQNGLWWLFCTFQDDHPNARLHAFYADCLEGSWQPHALNPIKDELSGTRPGGALFEVDGKLVRPAQDSSNTYGGALKLQHVTLLTPSQFAEETLQTLNPPRGSYGQGLHTLTGVGDVSVIDAKRWRYHLFEPVRKLITARKVRHRKVSAQ